MNVLSIDLDFLFKMEEIEENKIDECGIELLNEQANLLFELILYLLKDKNKKIKIIDSHEKILKYINEECLLINIDQHHDLHYSDLHCSMVDNNTFFDEEKEDQESCWVYWLHKNKLLKDYYWIGNEDSEVNIEILKYGYKFFLKEGSTLNPYFIYDYLKTLDFDLIVFCNSKNYISNEQYLYCLDKIKKMNLRYEICH